MKFPKFLRIAVVPHDYFITFKNKTEDDYEITGGSEGELIKICAQALKFSYKLVFSRDGWGSFENGKWNGVIGIVYRNEADIAITKIGESYQRHQYVDFSFPYAMEEFTFGTRKPSLKLSAYAIVHPFSFKLWLTIIIAILFMTAIFSRFQKREFILSMQQVCGILISQSVRTSVKNKFLLSAWIWGSLFLSYSYIAVLLSFLTVPLKENVPENYEELSAAITAGTYKAMTLKGTMLLLELFGSKREDIQIIAQHIEKNNHIIAPNRSIIADTLRNEKMALIGPKTTLKFFMHEEFPFSKDSLKFHATGIVMSKSFCCKNEIDSFVHVVFASGIHQKLTDDTLFKLNLKADAFDKTDPHKATARPLSLADLHGAFVLVISGHIIAFVVVLGELFYFRIRVWKKKDKKVKKMYSRASLRLKKLIFKFQ